MVTSIRLTEAQFAVLESLWRDGAQTIRQLTATLYPSQTTSDYVEITGKRGSNCWWSASTGGIQWPGSHAGSCVARPTSAATVGL